MIVVKFGGHAMSDQDGAFAETIARAQKSGIKIVIVHGGGPQIDFALSQAGITSDFLGGFRVTTPEIFDIVERVLSLEVGPSVVATLARAGVAAVSLSGRTSNTLIATPLRHLVDGTPAELGLVGVVSHVNSEPIGHLVEAGSIPVISPIATDSTFTQGFNVNADLAAAAIAGALDAQSLIIMTDVEGIYRDFSDKASLIDRITAIELEAIKGSFEKGMAPKVKACLDAIAAGASAVRIIDGTNPSALAAALIGKGGTLVVAA
jgi:acetylglutamate kinase